MIKRIDNKRMGGSNLGWLKSKFHFSFAEYYNPNNINFGVLRVVNDDLIEAGYGFGMHPHRDMEIISYVIDGEITHEDSMGHKGVVSRGDGQYMSAGTGVMHSERNDGKELLRLLQIWIFPDKNGYTPHYGDFKTSFEDRHNKWLKIVSSFDGDGISKIHQDVNFYVSELDEGKELELEIKEGRQAYFIQIEGDSEVNEVKLFERDAAEIVEENIKVKALKKAHIMVIEMPKDDEVIN